MQQFGISCTTREQKHMTRPASERCQLVSHRLLGNHFLLCYPERAGAFKIMFFHTYFIDDQLATACAGDLMQKR